MIRKIIEDLPNLDESIAAQYETSNIGFCFDALGFNPAYLAIEQNPKLPFTFRNTLSTLQARSTSSIITQNVNIKLTAHRVLFF